MLILRSEHADKPNEVAVYFTEDQFSDANLLLLTSGRRPIAEFKEPESRRFCQGILSLSNPEARPQRLIADLDDKTRLDSADLGHDLVERMTGSQDPAVFDPDYHPVEFTFRVLSTEGASLIAEVTRTADFNAAKIKRALDTARLAVRFSFNPPNLV